MSERGMALVFVLFVLLLLGALITGTFFAGLTEVRSSRNVWYQLQASEAAETGLVDAIHGTYPTSRGAWAAIPVGKELPGPWAYPVIGRMTLRYNLAALRMAGGVYRITSTGETLDQSGNPLAMRVLAAFVKVLGDSGFVLLDERAWSAVSP